jgi:hypothetical protein
MKVVISENQSLKSLELYLSKFVNSTSDYDWVDEIRVIKGKDAPLMDSLPYIQYFFHIKKDRYNKNLSELVSYESQKKLYNEVDKIHKLMYPNKLGLGNIILPTGYFSVYIALPNGINYNIPTKFF